MTAMPHYPQWKVYDGFSGHTRREKHHPIQLTRLRHYVPSKPASVPRLISELSFGLRLLVERWGRPDLVLFVSPALFSSAMASLKWKVVGRGRPSVVWLQDVYSLGVVEAGLSREGGVVSGLIRAVEGWVLSEASAVCAIHERIAAAAVALGCNPESVRVIRNWTHLRALHRRPSRAARDQFGWEQNEIIALHSGNMGLKQDLRNVVEAARLADGRGAPVRFVLMGDGAERSKLESHGVGIRSLQFLDPLPGEEYQTALGVADVLLVNEMAGMRDMAVPSKLTSYFSAGRPIIAATSAESATAMEIEASGAGVRVEAGSPESLLDAILQIGLAPKVAKELGERGQAFQESELTEQFALDTFESWLTGLVDGNRELALVNPGRTTGRRRGVRAQK